MGRIYNFGAGPSMMPLPVLEQAQRELLDYKGSGMSMLEISHRNALFEEVNDQAQAHIKQLLGMDDSWVVMFMGGGASLQFSMIPMNFLTPGKVAAYAITSTFSEKAIKEAHKVGKAVEIYSSKATGLDRVPRPEELKLPENCAYLHLTGNCTAEGLEYFDYPDTGDVPLIVDMSSDILSRTIPLDKFSLIYNGAQKNIGPAGVTVVMAKKEFLKGRDPQLPTMMNYETFADHDSTYNTPPVFGVYLVDLMSQWLLDQGGLGAMEKRNRAKAKLVYDVLDAHPGFYRGHAQKDSRSLMNVTFNLPSKELETRFVAEAKEQGLAGLKGHRSIGGIRASIYNAMPLEGAQALTDFMENFWKNNR
ncbi:3-phosphoserine/phosphohydroxythreonine transaminase [Acidaminococcus massiliensis]|uniref:3-phosphoserine/phosphohydroxythreonine transaminase n=1 Tax=Acidaminococcus massiliensis TaxID=1852375 RepID=UPI00266B5E0F|nr:3-phosphoserine/phosphohydroxythreonine transaminase [Acidaminococcus massiliensis]